MLNAIRHGRRLLGLLRSLGRHDALFVLDELPLSGPARQGLRLLAGRARPPAPGLRRGERLAEALHELGPSFIKLGQALSVRADLLGEEIASDLGRLRDRLPPAPWPATRAIIEGELGRPPDELFAEIDEVPVAAASIAQVHFARTRDGLPVAVKVLRPEVEAAFRQDLELFTWMAAAAERHHPPVRRLRPGDVVRTLAETVAQEMDLRMEAAAASELAENFAGDERFRVPRIHWPLTGRRVLTMDRVDGIALDQRTDLLAAGHDPARLATTLIQIFLSQALRHGFFHADLHQGNLFVDAAGTIHAVDFGIMGRLDRPTRLFMAEMLHAFLEGDWRRAADVHFRAGYVPADRSVEAFAQACRAIGEPILGRPVNEISLGRLLAQLFQVTEMFGMPTQPHLLLLQKTMVTVEGVARTLDREVNFWEAARPVVEPWAEENFAPEARLRDALEQGARALGRLPGMLSALAERLERTQPPSGREDGARRRWAGSWPWIALALVALLLLSR
ncbi:MAG: 2-polyprenylphenol 6-hydroxylase [Alphaproteobacteria bacterium]|nr:2-polyprenylphenol 6-hydroxylase [Alphaproteobacteria bacterium]